MADVINNYKFLSDNIDYLLFKQKYETFQHKLFSHISKKIIDIQNRFLTEDGNFRSIKEEDLRKLKESMEFSSQVQPLRDIGWNIPNTLEEILNK